MDPVTAAIVAALAAGAATVAEQAIVDAYAGLKALLERKFGAAGPLAAATASLEAKPDSTPRQQVLAEEVAAAGADTDAEVLAAAEALQAQVGATPAGKAIIQRVVGSYNAIAGDHSRASVTVHRPRK